MEAPREDAKIIIGDRFPCPELLVTFTGDGKERWLKCVLNPSSNEVEDNECLEVSFIYGYLNSIGIKF